MAQRSPEDVLAGILRIATRAGERQVPTLSIAATRTWQASLEPIFAPREWDAAAVAAFGALEAGLLVDVVVGYDTTNALGGREWIENNADPAQLYAAALQMMEVAFPLAEPAGLLAGLIKLAEPSKPPSGTSGLSHIGGSTRGRSKRASTRAS